MKRPIRPYVQPKSAHHQFNFVRAFDILRGRQKGLTFAELAKRYGVTTSRVQQIYQQVMRRGGMAYLIRNAGSHGGKINKTFRS